ncbi:cytochrome P450 714C2-like [Durio zibethinus]|uniref:Cytochrome P450 714C2-like n=1 Tax=Durio zibethinus TaxID=66656 RepID=A0A6P5XQX9_DURZI|nr:cytochrome P450 714C2-like [Durio zibethinus]
MLFELYFCFILVCIRCFYCNLRSNVSFHAQTRSVFPTEKNREIRRLEKEIHSTIMDIVKHTESASKDLLHVIIEGSQSVDLGPSTADQFIVDNCKDICIPASEVTPVAAIWGLMLLASHSEWQTRLPTEVLEVSKDGILNFEMLHKMKAVCNSMI